MRNHVMNTERMIGYPLLLLLAVFPLFSSNFHIGLMGKFLVLVIFAISLDLIWGYAGLLSIGHAAFFGMGGYVLALSYTFQKGVPAFMQRFDINEIPFFMTPLLSVPVAVVLGLVIPFIISGIIGFFIFKSKVSGVYFSLITLVLASLFEMLIINLQAYTGGFNGLMGLPRFPIFGKPLSIVASYYIVLIIAIIIYFFTKWLTQSHFGKVVKAIRENEDRVSFLTYDPAYFKVFIYMISGLIAGLAGMLYVSMNGFIGPSDVGLGLSLMVILWVAIGGRGKLMGAVVGALLINWLSNSLSESYPEIWQLIVGIIMVLVVLFLPDGIYGTLDNKWKQRKLLKKENKKHTIAG